MFFRSSDISALLGSQRRPRAAVYVDDGLMEAAAQGAPRGTSNHAVVVTAVTGGAVAAVAVVLMLIIRRRRMRQQESDQAAIMRNMEASYNFYCSIRRNFMCNFDTLSFV